jgi:small subunit ribosomal protein S16
MLVIRYFRIGKTNQPYFKIVVTDQRMPIRGGRFVEEVGFSDPIKKKKTLNADRIKFWLSKGAQPSDSIYNLLVSEKIIEGKKRDVHNKKKVKEGAPGAAVPATPAAAAPAAAAPVAAVPVPAEVKPATETPKAEAKKEEPKVEPTTADVPKEEAK